MGLGHSQLVHRRVAHDLKYGLSLRHVHDLRLVEAEADVGEVSFPASKVSADVDDNDLAQQWHREAEHQRPHKHYWVCRVKM